MPETLQHFHMLPTAPVSWFQDCRLAQVAAAAQYLVRVTFGTALITSVLLVWFTIVAILTSSQSSDSDRRRAGLRVAGAPALLCGA